MSNNTETIEYGDKSSGSGETEGSPSVSIVSVILLTACFLAFLGGLLNFWLQKRSHTDRSFSSVETNPMQASMHDAEAAKAIQKVDHRNDQEEEEDETFVLVTRGGDQQTDAKV